MLDDKIKRVISGAVLALLILVFIFLGGVIFKLGVLMIIAIALYEYINVYRKTSNRVITGVLVFGFAVNIFIILFNRAELLLPMIYLMVLLSMVVPVFTKLYNVISSAITIVGYIYIINFFTLLAFIREWKGGNRLILLVFIIAWFSDTFAYYVGRQFGKRKLCPEVSPKKTVAGFIGGIIGSVAGVLLWASFIVEINSTWYQLVLLGLIAGIISQIGDLVASLIKRYIGVKDYGNLIPGHGGILDRFDSILFTTPIVYYYIKLIMGW